MTNREAALQVVKTLRTAGHQALFAGGCVRDRLLGRCPKDYDVATDAHPRVVMKAFDRTLKVGAKFGVVMVLLDQQQIEVATFRSEAGYVDGRHPGQVHFTDAREDALRRDFTINGMFYDPLADEVIDFVEGQQDLERRVIRTIGVPDERFSEDYLRMLRAVRFSTQLDFPIEDQTYASIQRLGARIQGISAERIAMEVGQILLAPRRAQGMALLRDTGLLEVVFPGCDHLDQGIAVLEHLRHPITIGLGLAAVLSGLETERALDYVSTLKPSREQLKQVRFLLERRDILVSDPLSKATLRRLLASPYYAELFALQRARLKARGDSLGPLIQLRHRMREFAGIELTPTPLLKGHTLMELGAIPGPMVGQLAEALYVAQLEGELETTEQAEQFARQWLACNKNTEYRT